MREAISIILQGLEFLSGGRWKLNHQKLIVPFRPLIKHSMEALINHFKIHSEGIIVS